MKYFVVGLLTFFLFRNSILLAADDAFTMREAIELFALTPTPQQERIDTLSPERRIALAEALKLHAKQSSSPTQFDSALVRLGDRETIRKYTDDVLYGNARKVVEAVQLLKTHPDAEIITAIGPALARDPNKEEYGNDMHDGELGLIIKDSVCHLLINVPGFTGEVKQWAREMEGSLGYFSKPLVEEWWKANREHFEKGEYLLVQPGGQMPPPGSYEAYEASPGRWKMRLKPEAANWSPLPSYRPVAKPPPAPSPAPPPSIVPPAKQTPTESRTDAPWNKGLLVAILLGIGLLLGGAWLSIRKKR